MPHEQADEDPWTFAVDDQGDLLMTSGHTIRTVEGIEATLQDLKVALATYKGTDPRDEDFGLDVFETFDSLYALRREVRRTLEYDDYRHDRVTSIQNIELFGHEGGSRQDITVHVSLSLADPPEDITLVFDLFSGSTAVVGSR